MPKSIKKKQKKVESPKIKKPESLPEASDIYALHGKSLGIPCYRGYASLSILSLMSDADEYDAEKNPTGTQRELKKKHALEAYEYAKKESISDIVLWPEIILNIRDSSVIEITTINEIENSNINFVKLSINWDKLFKLKSESAIAISRVDGNHRLYFAGGLISKKNPALDKVISPFCIMDISEVDEKILFRTINKEQKPLSANHLLRIEQQTKSSDMLWDSNKTLWLAQQLNDDSASPLYKQVHIAGKKTKHSTSIIGTKTLSDFIDRAREQFTEFDKLTKDHAKNFFINFFDAAKIVWSNEWVDHDTYKMFNAAPFHALGSFAGTLMHNCYTTKSAKVEDFQKEMILIKQKIPHFWRADSPNIHGRGGATGAKAIFADLKNAQSEATDPQQIVF